MTAAPVPYPGSELALFREAANWKAYWARAIARYVGGRVLEVGAGIGATIDVLGHGGREEWVSVEPDAALAAILTARRARGELPPHCRVVEGTIRDLPATALFDSVLYIDVLEHIEDDAGEVARAASHLAPGGHLVVLAPAHAWLFTPFDRAIGHHRRYSRRGLAALRPPGLEEVEARYLDSVGLLASIANRLVLRASMPTLRQIRLWDDVMVRLSRTLDPLLGYLVGKSIAVVWRRPPETHPLPSAHRSASRAERTQDATADVE